MTSRAVDMYEIKIPLDALKRLSDEDRFSYYLLGHMFNELMFLQKNAGFLLPKHNDKRPARLRPEIGQALFVFRLAAGKIWEAHRAINHKHLSLTLRTLVLPRMVGGTERLKEVNAAISAARWLSPMRNGLGFHFPSFDEWKPHIVPDETWADDSIFLGKQTGNTFYDAADTVAQAWMFSQYSAPSIRQAVDPLIEQMIDLLRLLNTFLEDILTVFIHDVILERKEERKTIGKVLAPEHEHFEIPFWTAMPRKN